MTHGLHTIRRIALMTVCTTALATTAHLSTMSARFTRRPTMRGETGWSPMGGILTAP
jgi:hypothetical protein